MDKNVIGIVDTVKDSSLVNRKSPSFIRWWRIIRVELKALKNGVFKLWKVTLSSRIICKRSWNSHFTIKVGQIKKSKLCEVRFHDVWKSQKKSHSILRAKNCPFGEFLKTWKFGQTVLPDRSVLVGQKLVENSKIPKFKRDILSNFQTMCTHSSSTCATNLGVPVLLLNRVVPIFKCESVATRTLPEIEPW